MTDLVVSTFAVVSGNYRPVPAIEFEYLEVNSPIRWHLSAGGSRAYTLRFGPAIGAANHENIEAQNVNSHFLIYRILHALVLAGEGFFTVRAVSRFFVANVGSQWDAHTQLDFPIGGRVEVAPAFHDWFEALTRFLPLRRASADLYNALVYPHEAALFTYRGLECLVVGEGRSWEDLAVDTGLAVAEVRDFKKMANVDYGIRHASKSGKKLRANAGTTAEFIAILFDAINASRGRLDSQFKPISPEMIAQAIFAAMPADPFP